MCPLPWSLDHGSPFPVPTGHPPLADSENCLWTVMPVIHEQG